MRKGAISHEKARTRANALEHARFCENSSHRVRSRVNTKNIFTWVYVSIKPEQLTAINRPPKAEVVFMSVSTGFDKSLVFNYCRFMPKACSGPVVIHVPHHRW